MHLLQSVFQLIDLYDLVSLEELREPQIQRNGDISWSEEKDLCVRAAKLLQKFAPSKGVRISVKKNIPSEAGLGGGSSDAATTLIGLNRLWNLGLSRKELMAMGAELGADVPFFIGGTNAFVEGIGEKLTPIKLSKRSFVVLKPKEGLSTGEIFSDPDLTRDSPLCKILPSDEGLEITDTFESMRNDLQSVAISKVSSLREMFNHPFLTGKIRMTGSGTAVFYTVKSCSLATVPENLPDTWKHWVVNSLELHPLQGWMEPL